MMYFENSVSIKKNTMQMQNSIKGNEINCMTV